MYRNNFLKIIFWSQRTVHQFRPHRSLEPRRLHSLSPSDQPLLYLCVDGRKQGHSKSQSHHFLVPVPSRNKSPNYWSLKRNSDGEALVGTYPWSHQMWLQNTEVICLIYLLRISCEAETLWKEIVRVSKYENTPGTCIMSSKNVYVLWSHSPNFRNLPVVSYLVIQ